MDYIRQTFAILKKCAFHLSSIQWSHRWSSWSSPPFYFIGTPSNQRFSIVALSEYSILTRSSPMLLYLVKLQPIYSFHHLSKSLDQVETISFNCPPFTWIPCIYTLVRVYICHAFPLRRTKVAPSDPSRASKTTKIICHSVHFFHFGISGMGIPSGLSMNCL